MKVTVILKGMIDSNGEQPIQIRLNNGPIRSYHPTGIKVKPDNFKAGKIIDHPKAKQLNELLSHKLIEVQSKHIEGVKKAPKVYLYDYIQTYLKQVSSARRGGTVRQYNSQVTKLKEFTHNLLLNSIDKSFLYDYQNFLIRRGNEPNTVWSSFKFLRTLLRKADDENLIKTPFKGFPFPKYIDTNMVHLSIEEINKIDKFSQDKNCPESLRFPATWFVLACNTGLRLSDLKSFSKSMIHSNRLIIQTQKANEYVGLPISPKIKDLLKRVNYSPLDISGEDYNRKLKDIAIILKIHKRVSSHTARHSCAMMLADAGVSQEVAAKILGHKDMRSTKTYYKISNKRVDDELKKLK
jgi:integrase/recombinase XerD